MGEGGGPTNLTGPTPQSPTVHFDLESRGTSPMDKKDGAQNPFRRRSEVRVIHRFVTSESPVRNQGKMLEELQNYWKPKKFKLSEIMMMSNSENDKGSLKRGREDGSQPEILIGGSPIKETELYNLFDPKEARLREQEEKNERIRREVNPDFYRKLDRQKELQMFKIMNDLVMDQIRLEINEAIRVGDIEEINKKMDQNKLHFCKMIIRKPKMQTLFQGFMEQIKVFIKKEVNYNGPQMNKFLQKAREDEELQDIYPNIQ